MLKLLIMRKHSKQKDETPLQFFLNLSIPEHWRFIGDFDVRFSPSPGHMSYGKLYQVSKGIVWRVFFQVPAHRGGICEKDCTEPNVKHNGLIDNKQSAEINEYIQMHGAHTIV